MKTSNPEFENKNLSVLRNIEDPKSGHVFIHIAPTIKDELSNYERLLDNPDITEDVHTLLNQHRIRTRETAESIIGEKEQMTMSATRKSPNPCPGDTSSCLLYASYVDYFDVDYNEEIKIFKNDRLIEAETVNYDPLTKIRTVKLAEELVYNNEDTVRIELPLTFHNEDGSVEKRLFSKQIPSPGI
jgi:hypothetical protein